MKGRRAREPRERSKAGVSAGFIDSGVFAIKTPREHFQFLFDELKILKQLSQLLKNL
jgi:hypothetical protein